MTTPTRTSYWNAIYGGRIIACCGPSLPPSTQAGLDLPWCTAGLTWGMVARDVHGKGAGRQWLHQRLDWLRIHHPTVTEVQLVTGQLTAPYSARHRFRVTSSTPGGFRAGP